MNNNIKKVLVWRAISIFIGWGITYLFFDEIIKSLKLILIASVILTVIHYFFEKAWEE